MLSVTQAENKTVTLNTANLLAGEQHVAIRKLIPETVSYINLVKPILNLCN
ncbi:UNVERIFIED_CONTAM: hypothetical protein FKN15_011252 [Acipenser sinensis]